MTPTYKLFLIPLDSARAEASPERFDAKVICNLEFPQGSSSPASVAAAIAAHPLFHSGSINPIRAYAVEYGAWVRAGHVITSGATDTVPATLTYIGARLARTLQDNLLRYLTRPGDVDVAQLLHDSRFDDLSLNDFLDIAQVNDDLTAVRSAFLDDAAEQFGFKEALSLRSMSPESFSFDQARWLNSHAQTLLLDALFERPGAKTVLMRAEISQSFSRLKKAVRQIEARLSAAIPAPAKGASKLRSRTQNGETDVSPQDPNVSMHAALKNGLIAESIGLVTAWRAEAAKPILGDYVMVIDTSTFGVDPAIAGVTTQATALRRRNYTHPLSFSDVGSQLTTNAALALLNTADGTPRYRATAINSETFVVQNTLLQANNSLSNSSGDVIAQGQNYTQPRDDRPPQLLSDDHFGINEPECSGLTISAPIDDLLTPAELKDPQRATKLPCLFLEDLWVGYRLDLAQSAGGALLLSVHRQHQEISFVNTPMKIQGETEDFFAREQADESSANVTSTELFRYLGLSSAQAQDYARFLGTYKEPIYEPKPPFNVRIPSYSDATPIVFGQTYDYRLRNVFLGAISLSDKDPRLATFGDGYRQTFPFYRARAFRPGEVVSIGRQPDKAPGLGGRPIFLTVEKPRTSVWVVPTPVDTDTARYHAQFLVKGSDPRRNSHRAFVTDVSKYFNDYSANDQYYVDPDVSGILIRLTLLNGDVNATNHEFVYQNGSFCELARHLRLPTERGRFGAEGNWERFLPIQISFAITNTSRPKLTSDSTHRRIHVEVPPGGVIELSLIPDVSQEKIQKTSTFASSSTQLKSRRLRAATDDGVTPVPTMVEHKIRAVHCLKRPIASPSFGNPATTTARDASTVVIAERAVSSTTAELNGYLQLDAASTGQVRLEASWSDIDDGLQHPQAILQPGAVVTSSRSVAFERYKPPSGATVARADDRALPDLVRTASFSLAEMFELQCAENKVFLGGSAQTVRSCVLDFKDTRRKQAVVQAVATSRYKDQFVKDAASAFEMRSDKIRIEVPASMSLPSPDISHVVPLSRDISEDQGYDHRTQRVYAMRIYIRRPWFLSGPCERLAIGCLAGEFRDGPTATLNKYITQWGEDPVERPKLEVSRRAPRASDFRLPDTGHQVLLDHSIYPEHSLEGVSPIIYRDSVVRLAAGKDPTTDVLSAASFGLRWDQTARLWYCDVEVAEGFFGWCGLALYRHQPNALEGMQLSATPAWVYGAILHGDQLAWTERSGKLHVTVGPVFDRYTTYELDSAEFRSGISRNLVQHTSRRVSLKKYDVNGKAYFEGIVPAGSGWSLVKRRFDIDVASLPINEAGG